MGAIDFYAALGVEVPDRSGWVDIHCFTPDHDDRKASCGVNLDHGGFNCQACGAKGSAYDAAVLLGRSRRDAAELCKQHGLGHWDDDGGGVPARGSNNRATVQPPPAGCSLEQYAEHKRLPVDFLRGLGVVDYADNRWKGVRVLRVPYRTPDGEEPAVRIRHSLSKPTDGGDRFLWRKGSKPLLYGLDRLGAAREAGHVVIVEGESDCHTLWHHGVPALGLPGANSWNELRDAHHLAGIDRVYVVVEPDRGGEAVLGWLSRSAIKDRAWLVEMETHKDPSGLHLDNPDRFDERWVTVLESAEPWRARAAQIEDSERRDAWQQCADLAQLPSILDELGRDAASAGVTGEKQNVKLVYLAMVSRLLGRIVSLVVKGQSSSGKSWLVQVVLRFFPDEASYEMTAASEHALIYDKEPLEHRMLVIYEASGLESDTFSYIVRSLLSEGQLRYPTVMKRDGELVTVMIERDGPTGLITTTTALKIHPENETRLLSINSDDSEDQTAEVLLALADEDDDAGVDFDRWHALQRWLALGDQRVTIPYGKVIAGLIPPAATRLRRDFGQVLALIRTHALLHQATRGRNDKGFVVATLADYAAVRELVADVIAEAVEKTVKPEVREVVAAVTAHGGEQATQAALVADLKLDKGSVSRRVRAALDAGYLVNKEDKRGRPHKLIEGNPLPTDQEILPQPEAVERVLHGCAVDPPPGGHPPPPSTENGERFDWERRSAETATRIREQAAVAACSCADGGQGGGERCFRCFGGRGDR